MKDCTVVDYINNQNWQSFSLCMQATPPEKGTDMAKRINYKTSDMCHTTKDIVNAYNRRSYDIIQNTPGGSVSYSDSGRNVKFAFGRASIDMIDLITSKHFIFDEEKVNGRIRLVLKENESGISVSESHRKSGLDWRINNRSSYGKMLVMKHFPKTPEHPKTPKFQAHFIEGHTPNDESTWITLIPAKRKLV